jgi:hypothetical protein
VPQFGNALTWHTIKASEIASVSNGDAQVVEAPTVLVNQLHIIASP